MLAFSGTYISNDVEDFMKILAKGRRALGWQFDFWSQWFPGVSVVIQSETAIEGDSVENQWDLRPHWLCLGFGVWR